MCTIVRALDNTSCTDISTTLLGKEKDIIGFLSIHEVRMSYVHALLIFTFREK